MAFNFEEGELLLIDKPMGWTSFDVVNSIRSTIKKTLNIKKIKVGHAGTLDPLATGLLIVCTGKFTKRIDSFQDLDKVYIGSMFVGATTPSYDKETEVDSTFDINNISKSQLLETATQFLGETEQVPPIFSAVKIEGKRAFEYARKNNEVKLNSRKITIRKFELLSFDLPEINFIVECSKGTYIRSLVNDFGKALNNGAYMSSLRRTAIGNYTVSDALSVKEIKNAIVSYRE
ncbi:MAG: tRNA pseudouridine(55) synthase TruB [Bacteroidetes bacterium]|jgi:tRNA pseudouridine55 synthase|nr:tRNA pseudouridine(55) synthase TruB [Bacteroidota bacterium]|tara:strand:- start:562 stop:1257 length:696 start_codon:yes stop_codon:yes gene_type:complete